MPQSTDKRNQREFENQWYDNLMDLLNRIALKRVCVWIAITQMHVSLPPPSLNSSAWLARAVPISERMSSSSPERDSSILTVCCHPCDQRRRAFKHQELSASTSCLVFGFQSCKNFAKF